MNVFIRNTSLTYSSLLLITLMSQGLPKNSLRFLQDYTGCPNTRFTESSKCLHLRSEFYLPQVATLALVSIACSIARIFTQFAFGYK
jgi:hypothetical protein